MDSRSVKFIEAVGRMVAARTENRMGNEHLLVEERQFAREMSSGNMI